MRSAKSFTFALSLALFSCANAPTPATPPPRPSAPRGSAADDDLSDSATRAVQIALTESHACARMANGTVRCWGDNMEGVLGDGTTTQRHTPVLVGGVSDAVDIAVDLSSSCARLASGTLRCWGRSGFRELDEAESRGITRIWVGNGDGCARWESGATKCWGSGAAFLAAGHMGTYGTKPHPVTSALRDATDFAFHDQLGCARMIDGTVKCFGRNDNGQIGDGTTTTRLDPVDVTGLRGITQVSVGREFACALAEDGTVSCWGGNHAGQLGDGTTNEHHTPVPVPGVRNVVELASGSIHTCARQGDGQVTCWGWNQYGQLGNGTRSESAPPTVVPRLEHVKQIAATDTHTCALHGDGEIACWGQGWRGVLGDGLQADRLSPTAVRWSLKPKRSAGLPSGVRVKSVAVGAFHSCAALSDDTVRCWGSNDLNDAEPEVERAIPTPVVVPNVTNVTALTLGRASAGRLADGTVVQWGRTKTPTAGNLDHVAQYVEGGMVTCARFDDGRARCEGYQIAPGITLTGVLAVDVSHATPCALLADHTVTCAGYNGHGQLGDGSRVNERGTFGPLKSLRDVVQIALGTEHGCARLADGTVKCWGDATGAGADTIQDVPKAIAGLTGVIDIAAGGNASCARLAGGVVKCWGYWDFENFGKQPTEVPWLRGATSLALGMFHSCALAPDGSVLCWGGNQFGELGDGTMAERHVGLPVKW